jgi:NTP pyrophosphatase (non-canonical NTP hydrolase)
MNEELLGRELLRLWQEQAKFNHAVNELDYKDRTDEELAQTYLLGIHSEADEVLRELNWKAHRKEHKPPVNMTAMADHLADLTKYVWCLAQLVGMGPEDLIRAVSEKTDALWQVLGSEFSEPGPGQPVLVCDLDNTLARYTESVLAWFASKQYKVDETWFLKDTYRVREHIRVGSVEYYNLKLAWENEGGYASLPPYPDWTGAIKAMREVQGVYVVLATARPSRLSKRVWYDCWQWAKTYLGDVDRMLFCQEQRAAYVLEYMDAGHPVVWLEDSPEYADDIAEHEIPAVYHAHAYNLNVPCIRVGHNVLGLIDIIQEKIRAQR